MIELTEEQRQELKAAEPIAVDPASNTRLVHREPTQFLIDPASADGSLSGLKYASAVKCENIMTIAQVNILQTIGHLADALKQDLEDCLKAALELP